MYKPSGIISNYYFTTSNSFVINLQGLYSSLNFGMVLAFDQDSSQLKYTLSSAQLHVAVHSAITISLQHKLTTRSNNIQIWKKREADYNYYLHVPF